MQLPDGRLDTIQALTTPLLAACDDATATPPPALAAAFGRLADVMTRLEADAATTDPPAADITEIGEYALRLCQELTACAQRLQPAALHAQTAALTVNMALWIARLGGRIDTLEPVVDALALLANTYREPAVLDALGELIARIVDAVSALVSSDLEKTNPGRPWRVLLLNQSIVATRSHNTDRMEQAFAMLTRHLPEDAGRFFSEGMQQMIALDYPEPVRRVMEKYHRRWTRDRSLH